MNHFNFSRLKRGWNRINLFKRLASPFLPKNPVYVYHHIPKCGGTSLSHILNKWFIVVRDYRKDWSTDHVAKINIEKLRSVHCLAGHWELPGVYLSERYPDVLENDRYKLFTTLRDPLNVSLSLYRYEIQNNQTNITNLAEHFSIRPNYIATVLNVNHINYKEVLDKYFFVGILEDTAKSIKILTDLMGKKRYKIPWINTTNTNRETEFNNLSKSLIENFKKDNELDYLIYNYAKKRLSNY